MKKFAIFLLVCLVASSSVFALRGTVEVLSGFSAKEEVVVATESQPQQKTSSSTKSEKTSNAALTAQKDLEEVKVLKGDALEEHKENIQTLAEDYNLLAKYRNSVRPFVNGGIRVKIEEGHPTFGVQATGGVRFSSGVTLGTTIGYELVGISKAGFDWKEFALGQWDAALTVGYSW